MDNNSSIPEFPNPVIPLAAVLVARKTRSDSGASAWSLYSIPLRVKMFSYHIFSCETNKTAFNRKRAI